MTPKEQWYLAYGLARLIDNNSRDGEFPTHRVSKQMGLAIYYAQTKRYDDELSRRKPLRILRIQAQRKHIAAQRQCGHCRNDRPAAHHDGRNETAPVL